MVFFFLFRWVYFFDSFVESGLLTLIKSSIYRRVNSNDLACGWPFVLETGSWHYFRNHAKEVQLRAGRNLYHRYTCTLLKYLPTYLDEHIVKEEVEHGLNILTRQKQPATSFIFSPYGIVMAINTDIFFA